MKVLLIIIDRMLWQRIGQSLLIWLMTGLLGSVVFGVRSISDLPLWEIIIISLVFSAPAVVCLFPIFYFLKQIPTRGKRIVFAIASILMVCIVVTAIFLRIIDQYSYLKLMVDPEIVSLMLPYVFAAELSFFLVARKQILSKSSVPTFLV